MVAKAVLITEGNKDYLRIRFPWGPYDEVLPVGLYLVTDFGVEEHFSLLTEENLNKSYNKSGIELANDFFEIWPKRSTMRPRNLAKWLNFGKK